MSFSTIKINISKPIRRSLLWHFTFLICCYSFAMIIFGKGGLPLGLALFGGIISLNEFLVPSIIGWIGIVIILFSILKINYSHVFVSFCFATFCIVVSWVMLAFFSDNFIFTIITSIPFLFSAMIWLLKIIKMKDRSGTDQSLANANG